MLFAFQRKNIIVQFNRLFRFNECSAARIAFPVKNSFDLTLVFSLHSYHSPAIQKRFLNVCRIT